jgi:hypothetical protein
MVELMVSVSILSLLVVMLTSIFNVAMQSWTSSEGGSDRRRGGRSMTDFIGSELRGALLPVTQSAPVGSDGVRIANLQLIINPPQLSDEYRTGDNIFWQAPLATEKTYGDVAEIGYFIKWIQNGAKTTPTLCRFFVNPSMTDSTGNQVLENPLFQIYGTRNGGGPPNYTDVDGWLSDNILDAAAPADKASGYRGLFLENVLGLWVRAYGVDGRELPRAYSSRVFDDQVSDLVTETPQPDSSVPSGYVVATGGGTNTLFAEPHYLPSTIRISIAQLDARHAIKLGPAITELKQIAAAPEIREASQFMERLKQAANESGPIRNILPGVRIYSTDVPLENAR